MAQTITASFGLDINPLKAGFNRAASLSASAARNIGSRISAFITSPLAAVTAAASGFLTYETFKHGIEGVMETGNQLAKLSTKTGIAVGSLATLESIFKAAEVPAESLGGSIGKMQRNLFQAAKAGGPAGSALRTLNLTAQDLLKLKPEEEFVAIGRAINALPTPILRTNTAMALFGRSGMDLLPVFSELGDVDFAHLSAKAQILEKDAHVFEETSKAFRKARSNLQGVFYGMADALVPSMLALSKLLSKKSAVEFGIELGKGIRTATEYLFGVFADPGAFGDLIANAVLYGYSKAGNFLVNNLAEAAIFFTENMLIGVDVIGRALQAGIAVGNDNFKLGVDVLHAGLILAGKSFGDMIIGAAIEAAKFLKLDTTLLEVSRTAAGAVADSTARGILAGAKVPRTFGQAYAQQPLTGAGKLAAKSMGSSHAGDSDFFGAANFAAGMQKSAAKLHQAGVAAIAPYIVAPEAATAGPAKFAPMNGGLQTGGLRTGSLSAGSLMGGAYGAVHAGDAARRKAESAKKDKDPNDARFTELMATLKEGLTGD